MGATMAPTGQMHPQNGNDRGLRHPPARHQALLSMLVQIVVQMLVGRPVCLPLSHGHNRGQTWTCYCQDLDYELLCCWKGRVQATSACNASPFILMHLCAPHPQAHGIHVGIVLYVALV